MFTDYAGLQAEITDWFARNDMASKTGTFIGLGEQRIYRELRVRQMEKALSGAMVSGVFALPADYLEVKNLRTVGAPDVPLDRSGVFELYALYPRNGYTGQPRAFARDGANLVFGPAPDADRSLAGTYYAKLPPLSATNTTNWIITDVPDLILAASMKEAAAYTMDAEAVGYWEDRYQSYKSQVQGQDDREGLSGSPPVARCV